MDSGLEEPCSANPLAEANVRPYQYSALHEGYIRLVGIDSGTGISGVRGTIEDHPLCDAPPYAALSYCWGDSTLDRYIYVPDALPVTANLHAALVSIGRMATAYVWADAICINQNNISERNHQVLLMRQIYEKATGIVIYLGEDKDGSQRIPQLVHALQMFDDYRNFRQRRDENVFEYANRTTRNRELHRDHGVAIDSWVPGENGFGWRDGEYVPDENAVQWRALGAFLQRPWFTRVWIIQEASANEKTLVLCGCWFMGLVHLMGLVANTCWLKRYGIMEDNEHQVPKIGDAIEQMNLIGGLSVDLWQDRNVPLLRLLQRCRRSQATLEIDRLYAVLGLSAEATEADLAPDYSLSAHKAVRNYARFFIRNGHGIEMLKQVDITTWSTDLPSWMPDWTTYNTYIPWLGQPSEPGRVAYRAGGDSHEAMLRETRDTIALRGFVFDKIVLLGQDRRSVSLGSTPGHTDMNEKGRIWTCVSEPIEMLRVDSIYDSPIEKQQAASVYVHGRTTATGVTARRLLRNMLHSGQAYFGYPLWTYAP